MIRKNVLVGVTNDLPGQSTIAVNCNCKNALLFRTYVTQKSSVPVLSKFNISNKRWCSTLVICDLHYRRKNTLEPYSCMLQQQAITAKTTQNRYNVDTNF